jgi:hypothetical protein
MNNSIYDFQSPDVNEQVCYFNNLLLFNADDRTGNSDALSRTKIHLRFNSIIESTIVKNNVTQST